MDTGEEAWRAQRAGSNQIKMREDQSNWYLWITMAEYKERCTCLKDLHIGGEIVTDRWEYRVCIKFRTKYHLSKLAHTYTHIYLPATPPANDLTQLIALTIHRWLG